MAIMEEGKVIALISFTKTSYVGTYEVPNGSIIDDPLPEFE